MARIKGKASQFIIVVFKLATLVVSHQVFKVLQWIMNIGSPSDGVLDIHLWMHLQFLLLCFLLGEVDARWYLGVIYLHGGWSLVDVPTRTHMQLVEWGWGPTVTVLFKCLLLHIYFLRNKILILSLLELLFDIHLHFLSMFRETRSDIVINGPFTSGILPGIMFLMCGMH